MNMLKEKEKLLHMYTEPFFKWLEYKKQCRQNLAIVIWIYGDSMTADAKCRHKFRGLY